MPRWVELFDVFFFFLLSPTASALFMPSSFLHHNAQFVFVLHRLSRQRGNGEFSWKCERFTVAVWLESFLRPRRWCAAMFVEQNGHSKELFVFSHYYSRFCFSITLTFCSFINMVLFAHFYRRFLYIFTLFKLLVTDFRHPTERRGFFKEIVQSDLITPAEL